MLKRKNKKALPEQLEDSLYPDDYWLDKEDGQEVSEPLPDGENPVSGKLRKEPMVTGYERTENTATATNVNTNRTGAAATTEEKRTRAGKLAEGHGQRRISSQCGDGRRSQLQYDRRTDEQRPQGKRER